MAETIDLTGDGGVLKTVVRKAKDDAIEPSDSLPLVDGTFFKPTRSSIIDESPVTHSSYAKQLHSVHCFRWSAPNYKFFFYAQKDGATAFFLVECIVNTVSTKAQLKIKADDVTAAEATAFFYDDLASAIAQSE